MKHFIDGDMVAIVKDDFVDLQESPAVFMPVDSYYGQKVASDGVLMLPIGVMRQVIDLLNDGGGVLSGQDPWARP